MPNLAGVDWPSPTTNIGWGPNPSAVLPGRVQGWPSGNQRAASRAERLLSQAVAWWDASTFKDGDRFLRNRGTAGPSLDMRMGSSVAPNSNDPRFLSPEERGYVYFPGVGTNDLTVAHDSSFNIASDIDIRVQCSLDTWPPPNNSRLIGKYGDAGARSYYFDVEGISGYLRFFYSQDGTNLTAVYSGMATAPGLPTALSNQNVKWLRVTVQFSASSSTVTFFISNDGSSWTQLGPSTDTGISAPTFASTSPISMGTVTGLPGPLAGKIYRAQIFDGVNGTKVLDVDCDQIKSGATSFTALTGQTADITRSTLNNRQLSVVPRGTANHRMLLGQDDYLEVLDAWQHSLLNFSQDESFTAIVVVRSWGTLNNPRPYIRKGLNSESGAWGISLESNSNIASIGLSNGLTPISLQGPGQTLGSLAVLSGVVNRNSNTYRMYLGGDYTEASLTGFSSTRSNQVTRIGASSNPSGFVPMRGEFYAAAVFRRALTLNEIKQISDYYNARIN